MIHNPVDEGVFKADVASRFFRFQPLVPKNFLALRLKLLIQRKVFQASVHFHGVAFFGITLRLRVQNQFILLCGNKMARNKTNRGKDSHAGFLQNR